MNSRHQSHALRSHDQTERSDEQGGASCSDQPVRAGANDQQGARVSHLATFSDFVVQALRDGRFHSRPREPQHYVLTCKHVHRRSGASEYNPISYSTMFDEPGVLQCEDGRSSRCRVWWPTMNLCPHCGIHFCQKCGTLHAKNDVNAVNRKRPSTLRRKADRFLKHLYGQQPKAVRTGDDRDR
ncbi:hypothetical protein KCU95_g6756, partial [Aureobasidium melanogenum]